MIYLDHNATSPLLPEVRAAVEPWLGVPANPSSAHQLGQRAAVAVERARDQVAALVGGAPAGVIFTSGATEANHLFLRGIRPSRLALSQLEHPCVRAAATWLETQGTALSWLPVDAMGRVDLADLPAVDALSVMAANHETGVVQEIERALALCAERGITLHVDASQAAGRVPLALADAAGVVVSSHKLGGPAGVGALILPGGDSFPAQLTGGGQERGRRAGSLNVAGIVGFGVACALAASELGSRSTRWAGQGAAIERTVTALGGRVVAQGARRLPNTTCCIFPGISGELLVQILDLAGVAVSHGAACASGSLEPSPVLVAMGEAEPEGALRISLGPRTTDEQVEAALAAVRTAVHALGGASR